jgi:hypothetical protein
MDCKHDPLPSGVDAESHPVPLPPYLTCTAKGESHGHRVAVAHWKRFELFIGQALSAASHNACFTTDAISGRPLFIDRAESTLTTTKTSCANSKVHHRRPKLLVCLTSCSYSLAWACAFCYSRHLMHGVPA